MTFENLTLEQLKAEWTKQCRIFQNQNRKKIKLSSEFYWRKNYKFMDEIPNDEETTDETV